MLEVKRLLIPLLLLAGIVGLSGCGQVRDDEVSKPWTEPEPWERNLGIGPLTPE